MLEKHAANVWRKIVVGEGYETEVVWIMGLFFDGENEVAYGFRLVCIKYLLARTECNLNPPFYVIL